MYMYISIKPSIQEYAKCSQEVGMFSQNILPPDLCFNSATVRKLLDNIIRHFDPEAESFGKIYTKTFQLLITSLNILLNGGSVRTRYTGIAYAPQECRPERYTCACTNMLYIQIRTVYLPLYTVVFIIAHNRQQRATPHDNKT